MIFISTQKGNFNNTHKVFGNLLKTFTKDSDLL